MIRTLSVIILATLAYATFLLLLVSDGDHIRWWNKPTTECPLVRLTVDDGQLWYFSLRHVEDTTPQTFREVDFLGFSHGRAVQPVVRVDDAGGKWHSLTNVRSLTVAVPLWFVIVVFAAYPTVAYARGLRRGFRRYYRSRRGLCLGCGYDLSGNITGVCSECGEPT